MQSVLNKQEGGNHYKDLVIQPIEYIAKNNLDFLQGNVIKYVTRHKAKNGAQDIKKAMHYLELILALQYENEPPQQNFTKVLGFDNEQLKQAERLRCQNWITADAN